MLSCLKFISRFRMLEDYGGGVELEPFAFPRVCVCVCVLYVLPCTISTIPLKSIFSSADRFRGVRGFPTFTHTGPHYSLVV